MVHIFPQETPLGEGEKELERFEGYVDSIREDIAYLTLKSLQAGDTLWCECRATPLCDGGIKERRIFICRTVKQITGDVCVHFWPVPDVPLTEDEIKEIRARTDEIFSDDSLEGDY